MRLHDVCFCMCLLPLCLKCSCLCLFFSESTLPVTSRVCFVKFREAESVGVSQHLTNTVFVDRALIVVPFAEGWCTIYFECLLWSYATLYCWESEDTLKPLGWKQSSVILIWRLGWHFFICLPFPFFGYIEDVSLSQYGFWTLTFLTQDPFKK